MLRYGITESLIDAVSNTLFNYFGAQHKRNVYYLTMEGAVSAYTTIEIRKIAPRLGIEPDMLKEKLRHGDVISKLCFDSRYGKGHNLLYSWDGELDMNPCRRQLLLTLELLRFRHVISDLYRIIDHSERYSHVDMDDSPLSRVSSSSLFDTCDVERYVSSYNIQDETGYLK